MTRAITPTPLDLQVVRDVSISGIVTAPELTALNPGYGAQNALQRAAERGWLIVTEGPKARMYQLSDKGRRLMDGDKQANAPKAGPRTVSVMAGTYTGAKQSATRPGAEDFLRIPSRGLGT